MEYFDIHPAAHDPLAPPPLSEHSCRVKQVPFLLPPPAPELERSKKVISQKKTNITEIPKLLLFIAYTRARCPNWRTDRCGS